MTLVFSDTLTPLDDLGGIAAGRLVTTTIDGRTFVLSSGDLAYGRTTGLVVAELRANGALSVVDTVGTADNPLDGRVFGSQGLAILEKGNKTFVCMQGSATPGDPLEINRGVTVLEMNKSGKLSELQRIDKLSAFSFDVSQNGIDPSVVTSRGKDFLIQPSAYGDEVTSYRIRDNGTLALKEVSGDVTGAAGAMDTVTIGKNGYVVAGGDGLTTLVDVLKVDGKGKFSPVFSIGPEELLLNNRIIVDIKVEKVGGKTFAFVAESTAGTIVVYEMAKSGALTLVGYEQVGIEDRWQFPYSLETFEIDGQAYLVTGGNASGMGVFAVSKNGALTEVDEFRFDTGGLRWINELAVADINGRDFVVASTPIDSSLRSWRFDETNPEITGNGGANKISGTDQDDRMFGLARADRMFGKEGDDLIEGGTGNDRLFGGAGNDDLYGDKGNDRLNGGDGNNWLFGGGGRNTIIGGNGVDYAVGGAGKDRIVGNEGNDRMFGGAGNDTLVGGVGNDELYDGAGSDTLSGGENNDVFIFSNDGKTDFILDFEDGKDKIDLSAEGDSLIFPDIAVTAKGDGVEITYNGESIVITPLTGTLGVSDIGLDDFILA